MLSAALDLPFYDNVTPSLRPQVLKAHYIRRGTMPRGITVWRDGRDVMASFYHHSFHKFADIPINHDFVDAMRAKYSFTDYDDVRTNLPAFLESEMANPSYPSFTWAQFVDRWHGHPAFVEVRFEEFRKDPVASLSSLATKVSKRPVSHAKAQAAVEQFDIARIKKTQSPEEGKRFFVRSGKAGGWRDSYTQEALDIFESYAGRQLRMMGYE